MVDDESSALWADFATDTSEPLVVADLGDSGPSDIGGAPADDLSEADWDEPVGPEQPPDGVVVEPIAKYLPLLMQRKYGDDWELLLADSISPEDAVASEEAVYRTVISADDAEDDGASDAVLADEQATGGAEKAAWGDTSSDSQAPLAHEQIDEDDVEAVGDGHGGADEDEDAFIRALALAPPEEIADMLSPSLAEFLIRRRDGEIEVPEPFPASEWKFVFVTAVAERSRYHELGATWANLRVSLHENFEDLAAGHEDPADEPDAAGSALRKARALHAATGLPALAETTCCHVASQASKPPSETIFEMGDTVTELITRMRPSSAPEREVIFTSAAAYADGNTTCVGHGVCSMPLGVAEARHSTIATSTALDELFVKVCGAMGLKFVGSDAFEDFYELKQLKKGGKLQRTTGGSLLLKEKILREAQVLDASILKVSSFINHMVDVELMEACGEELAERLEDTQPTKVLTVEATGLLPGMFVGKALQLPVVFARKSRQIGVSDSYQTSFKSSTRGSAQDLYVSTEYLNPGDRCVIIDDFLAGGTTADALIRLCRMAGASVVGGGFLIEKVNDAGRAFLSGYQVPFESLAVVEITPAGNVEVKDDERSAAAAFSAQEAEALDALSQAASAADAADERWLIEDASAAPSALGDEDRSEDRDDGAAADS